MPTTPLVLVTGAAGKTGAATVAALTRRPDVAVRAMVRTFDPRAEALRRAGAEVVCGNLDDYRDVRRAMRGVQRAYFVAAPTQKSLDHALNFASAAVDERLEHVVSLGQWLSSPSHPSMATRRTWLTDRLMSWTPGVGHTNINVGWFADNVMPMIGMAAQLGVFMFPLGQGRAAPVSNEDIGAVVAEVLANPGPYAGQQLRPTGPAMVSPEDMAAAFADALGRSVRYVDLPVRMLRKAIRALGLAPRLFEVELPHYLRDYQRGAFEGVTDVVPRLTGCPAEEFRSIVGRYVAADPMARRSLRNTLRAARDFARIALTPARDADGWYREQDAPVIAAPTAALDNPAWNETHTRKEDLSWQQTKPMPLPEPSSVDSSSAIAATPAATTASSPRYHA